MQALFDFALSAGFVFGVLLLVSGFVFQSPPEVREAAPQVGPLYYPVLFGLLGLLVFLVGGAVLPGIHWDVVAQALKGGR